MKIVSFTYCESVSKNEVGGQLVICGPLLTLTPVNLPSTYSFVVSFGVYDINKGDDNRIKIEFKDCHDKIISMNETNQFDLPKEMKNSMQPVGIQVNVEFRNVVLKEEGTYTTTITINGKCIGTYPIDVICNKDGISGEI